jgi:ATP-dependent DNA ligase
VRLITRGGCNWTDRYPWIIEAARKTRQKQLILDGEAVILGVDGISDFDALHSGKHNDEVQLCAFDILAMDGDDLRALPLSMRKATLSSCCQEGRKASSSIVSSAARSALICFGPPAGWCLRHWCRGDEIGRIKRDGRNTGSR